MKTVEEQLAEIMRRAEILRQKREIRKLLWIAAVFGTITLIVLFLVSTLAAYIPIDASVYPLKYSPVLGGYALVGIPAFAAGVALTLALQKRRAIPENR